MAPAPAAVGKVNVWVFPGTSTGLASPVLNRSLTDWGWTNVKAGGAGDFNNDGYDDAVVFYNTAVGKVNVWVFPGTSTGLASPVLNSSLTDWGWTNVLG